MTMTQAQVLDEFRAAGALLEGHFILSSGLRSGRYLQCARVLMDAGPIDLVVSPAMGGVIVGYEMGRRSGHDGVQSNQLPHHAHQ